MDDSFASLSLTSQILPIAIIPRGSGLRRAPSIKKSRINTFLLCLIEQGVYERAGRELIADLVDGGAIRRDRPDAVIAAVTDIVNAVRDGGPLRVQEREPE